MSEGTRRRVRDLVMKYGWNATCYQIVNPIFEYSFFEEFDAVVAFVRARGRRVVAGAPVCPHQNLKLVLEAFHRLEKEPVVYFCAGDRVNEALGASSSVVSLGAQPIWHPQLWTAKVTGRKSLRYQFQRARNKGVTVREWSTAEAEDSDRLKNVLTDWLDCRGLPPLHFLVEPETLDFLEDRRTFVAELHGKPIAFLNLCPIPERNGWLTEQFPRQKGAPNGTVDLLMHYAVQTISTECAEYVTMGLVPFSEHGEPESNPGWLRLLTSVSKKLGRRFYSFRGLEEFKSKFMPDSWEPVYATSANGTFGMGELLAIVEAFTSETLWKTSFRVALRVFTRR